jgi:hypothetical protein
MFSIYSWGKMQMGLKSKFRELIDPFLSFRALYVAVFGLFSQCFE